MNSLRIILAATLFIVFAQIVFAQRQSILVAPQTTDPNISTNLNNHYVSITRAVAPKNQLFVFFPGTGGVAFNYQEINKTAADLGFHAVNLTYPNDEAVNDLCGAPNIDLECYRNMRLETIDGTDRTTLINVSRANSVENRLIKLLIYLRTQFPNDNWGQFLIDDSTINWSKIIVSGHSQGGGHAGIIGRYHPIIRAVMFAAMDFNGPNFAPATWISMPETTPNASTPDKFWGFSHTRDESVSFTLLSNRVWTAYGMNAFGAVVNVDNSAAPYNNTHSLTSNIECDNFHGCVAADARLVRVNGVPVFKPVWEYLLSNTVAPLSANLIEFTRAGETVNRPSVGLSTKYFRVIVSGNGFDINSKAVINGIETETEFIDENTLRAKLPAGKIGAVGRSILQIRNQNGELSNSLNF